MRYRVEWDTNLGRIHAIKEEDEVKEFVESLIALNFTPDVTLTEEM